ncbi:MAG: PD40 domain-containing protein [Bacteroidales bacterium]|nr:PD40 domain-containing protein [Bacteroidales bacterium]
MIRKITLLFLLIYPLIILSQDEARLMRFPTINGNKIVFTYAGDLYSVGSSGGLARKLTNHIGFEMFAKFSPDGKNIAFTGQYDGNTEVYLMPSEGGKPVRLTYTATLSRDDISDRMGPNNIVMAWTNDGQNITYRSRKQSYNSFIGCLFNVSINGGLSEGLPLPTGGFCSYSPDGKKLTYNKIFREFRTWKYYKGGMADDVWIFDFETKETVNITNNDAQNIFPMWHKNKIYFASDRERIMNLFVYDIQTKEIKKVTNFTEYDIKFPSLGDKSIIFENAGYIYVLDLQTEKYEKISIQITDDFISSRNEIKDASKNINYYSISPDGNRALFGARGDIYSVPAKSGITKNFTKSSGVHDRNPEWSPDGKYLAYISDETGEDEIYIIKQDGISKPVQLTKNTNIYKFNLKWSSDSKKILWNDKKFKLQYIDIETNEIRIVDKSEAGSIGSFDWSPDNKWIVYSRSEINKKNIICLYNIQDKSITEITQGWYYSTRPTFSNDGKYLVFTSSRDFSPIWNDVEWNFAYKDMNKIYLMTLNKNTPSPLAPKNDQVKINGDSENDTKKTKDEKIEQIKIDLEGISDRMISLPVKASNYWNINVVDNKIYYCERAHNSKTYSVKFFDLKENKETSIGTDISFEISADNKKMMIKKGNDYYIEKLPSSKIKTENKVDLSNMKILVDKKAEWDQVYYESWRQMRDFFYASNMHGVDWEAMKNKYAALLPYVNHRADLNYIIGELIGELSVGHAYTGNGDRPLPERIPMGLLGCEISHHSSGYYKIEKILKGENWDKRLRSPLEDVGVNVKEGDFIIAVNGESTKNMKNIYESLVNMADKQVELTINSKPEESGSKNVIVVPIDNEHELYYHNWVLNNIKKVNEATNNEVGYIHLPDMVSYGLNQFARTFYSQLSKKALIIDNRGNGGGNVSPMVIERLRRQLDYVNMRGESLYPRTSPGGMILGPKIMILDCYSASDGDLVAYRFRKNNLGKIIGTRSWGGVVGIRGSLPFIDGGTLRTPMLAPYAADGSGWIIEGYGVEPDIVIVNDPAKEYAGEDQQLNKAIELILEELKENKPELPPVPPFPDKSK